MMPPYRSTKTTSRNTVRYTYCGANTTSMLVFSSATTWCGCRSGSGSTGWLFLTRASIRSTILRASSRRLGNPEEQHYHHQEVQPGQQPLEGLVVGRDQVVRDPADQDDL